ncbi:MAG TPA: hypothetical protein VF707_07060 [Ardenticatenaceae bacterium]|jgi:hypothetical protein
MKRVVRWIVPSTAGALLAVVAIAVGSTFAQEPETTPSPTPPAQVTPSAPADAETGGRGFRGGHGGRFVGHEELAAALGITVEELDAAQEAAHAAVLQQAVAEGLITQEEADAILNGEGRRFHRHALRGSEIDYDALLAAELSISVEELEAAEDEARASALDAAVAEGLLTQEQADLIEAREALREYVDREAILAEALGMSAEELEAAKAEGQSLSDIIEAQGLDVETVRAEMQAGYEAAVEQAVTDGVITREQADAILSGEGFGGPGFRFGGRGRHGFGGPRGDFDSAPTMPESET